MKIPCSVGILTFNNEKTLEKALDSVKDFDEIIICDGGSTDRTLEISRSYNCKIIEQDSKYKYPDNRIADFSGVRNQILVLAKNDWFYYLDSDEYNTQILNFELLSIINKGETNFWVYKVPRRYVLQGKMIEMAMTYPNYQVRFFNKKAVNRFIKKVHERILVKEGFLTGELSNFMMVPHEVDVRELKNKYNDYNKIQINQIIQIKPLTFRDWFWWFIVGNSRVILLYIFRLIKIRFTKNKNKMPLKLEILKILNLLNLTIESFSKIKTF